LGQSDPSLRPHDLKQHPHSSIVIETLELSDEIDEGAGGNFDGLPLFQVNLVVDVPVGIGGLNKALHHAVRHWLWLPGGHEKAIDAKSAVD
jgi:hypothetical protein